jgi:mono/diheme cytochrome c family protein
VRRSFAYRPIGWARLHLRAIAIFAAGMASALAAVAATAGIVILLGLYDVGASTPHSAFMVWVTHTTFVSSVERQATETPEAPRFTMSQVQAGLLQYQQDCAECHGGPGVARASWVSGMNPTPPYLVDMGGRWTPSQLYWIIANGAKMTGMPAWRVSRSDRQIWDLVAFVEALPRISADDYARRVAANAGRTPAGMAGPD